MAVTPGALSTSFIAARSVGLVSAVATAGTTPYAYQWYRSTTSGFTPGGGNILSGLTSLTPTDSTVVPSTQYYYKVVVIDSAATPATGTSAQLSVLAAEALPNQNQFEQAPFLGQLDLGYSYNTVSAIVDNGVVGSFKAGQAVKYTQDDTGVPSVEPVAANTDITAGFVNYDIKSKVFIAGSRCEISQRGNVMYLIATAAIARGAQLMVDVLTPGGVITVTTGKPIIGWALDPATAPGQFIRVEITTPAFAVAP